MIIRRFCPLFLRKMNIKCIIAFHQSHDLKLKISLDETSQSSPFKSDICPQPEAGVARKSKRKSSNESSHPNHFVYRKATAAGLESATFVICKDQVG